MSTILQKIKRPVYIFAFGEYNSKQLNVSGIQHYLALYGQELRNENFNAANIYLFGIMLTNCKYIYRSFLGNQSLLLFNTGPRTPATLWPLTP